MMSLICPKCGHARTLKNASARRAIQRGSLCRYCQSKQAAKAGYRATVEKYGSDFFLEVIQQRERQKPSSAERALIAMLDELGAEYERQRIFRGPARSFVLDFVLSSGALVEVNGYWHKRNGTIRDSELAAAWSAQVVFIDADDITRAPFEVKEVLYNLIHAA